ncbi:RNA-guided endonuclease InsQ/TnpB family protein [Streptomyces sp. NPDC060085]|uniref:RNA-guided endonuclease InsQ/TnpB family protein n=1 Tax=Streptomyces sp. NPDC060085 TaxID=3347054 RepID=UPI00364975E6
MGVPTEVLKAFRFTLDPSPVQEETLLRHAGAARWAFNHALGMKVSAHRQWRLQVDELVAAGVSEAEARKRVRVPIPSKPAVQKHLNAIKGDSRTPDLAPGVAGPQRPCPWWHEVNTYAFQSAMIDADRAWQNWLASLSGRRAGRKVGYPRFKKKGRSREAFRLHHDVKRPGIRLATYRRLRLPAIGEIRLHDTGKALSRLISNGQAVVQSVTVARSGHRWYASVLCKVTADLPVKATAAQRAAGTVGVDLGVKTLAALSKPLPRTRGHANDTGLLVPNPRHLAAAMRRLKKAQQALSRTEKTSIRRRKAQRRVARIHHEVATRRHGVLHELTKRLATGFATVAVEDLHVAGMTRSAKGTREKPGQRVRQKSGLNRTILDTAMGEMRRQLTYKTSWYGSQLAVLDRWWPSSKTCSTCGWQNPHQTLADRVFTCTQCHLTLDRDLNAARNIERHATPIEPPVAPGRGETQNARGARVRPPGPRAERHPAMKREDTAPAPASTVPPQRNDPLTSPNPRQQPAKLP